MDSLSQIVLGAAAGELVLGKKEGNRAMLWGAIGGTIPDLDVLGGLFLSRVDNILFHRGFTHSITFSVLAGLLAGWLVYRFYQWRSSKNKGKPSTATLMQWQLLFFLAFFTHALLDCFTMYGTALLKPFSDYRIAWSTISVVDPLYTLPFLICLLVAARFHRESKKRRIWAYLGIGLSSTYLLFTVFNKSLVDRKFKHALNAQNIQVERMISNPTILNNILWSATAETEDYFYLGQYSLFDESEISFNKVDKNHHLLSNPDTDPTLRVLRKFSKDYFSIVPVGDQFQFNDLRFGTYSGNANNPNDFIFRFLIASKDNAPYSLEQSAAGPPPGESGEMMSNLWNRIWGRK